MATLKIEQSAKTDVWQAYRTAFQNFARQVRTVQELAKQAIPNAAAVDAALVELERARLIYDDRRNALALNLLPGSIRRLLPDGFEESPEARAERVKRIAQLLWDFSGRPEGVADGDWRRAEDIVRRAAAA